MSERGEGDRRTAEKYREREGTTSKKEDTKKKQSGRTKHS